MNWQKRLGSFSKACKELEEACAQGTYNKLERGGLIQAFEFTFELAWKTSKDWLEWQGYSVRSPREVLRTLSETGLLPPPTVETLLDALSKRNWPAHTYTESLAQTAVSLIRNDYFPALKKLADALEKEAGNEG